MDEDDRSLLAGLDLDAWAPPAVGSNFADRVIARVAATDEAIAVEVNRRSKRRWLYGTAITGVVAAAAAIIVWQMPGRPEPQADATGTIVASKPQRLVLDHASGDLDVGANVTWNHAGGVVTVAQRAGAATWHVDANQHLEINVGAAKASAQTSFEASDATLRVEANMNLADAKILGATAVTAASLITLIVYEGRVKATSGDGQYVIVRAGSVLAFPNKRAVVISTDTLPTDPNKPPVAFSTDGTAPKRVVVPQTARGDLAEVMVEPGENVSIDDLQGAVSVAIDPPTCDNDTVETVLQSYSSLEHDPYFNPILTPGVYPYTVQCTHGTKVDRGVITVAERDGEVLLEGTTPGVKRSVVPDVTAVRYDTTSFGIHYLIKRTPKAELHLRKKLDQTDVRMVMQTAEATLMGRCAIKAKMHLAFTILASGKVDGLTVTSDDKKGAECIKGIVSGMMFPKAQTGSTVTYPLSPVAVCNSDSLVDMGTQAEGRGDHTHALEAFELAYACKKDAHTLAIGFMAACNASKPSAARKFWKVMAPDTQEHLLQICLHNHITKDMLDAP